MGGSAVWVGMFGYANGHMHMQFHCKAAAPCATRQNYMGGSGGRANNFVACLSFTYLLYSSCTLVGLVFGIYEHTSKLWGRCGWLGGLLASAIHHFSGVWRMYVIFCLVCMRVGD